MQTFTRAVVASVALVVSASAAIAADPVDAVAGNKALWKKTEPSRLERARKRVPAYMLQSWAKPKRLLVWAKPGKTGVLHEPSNWIDAATGKPLASMKTGGPGMKGFGFDAETDLYLPPAAKSYRVSYKDRPKGRINARHIFVGDNGHLSPSSMACYGNIWCTAKGKVQARYSLTLTGGKDTFLRCDHEHLTPAILNAGDKKKLEHFLMVAQYLQIKKDKDSSVEFIGAVSQSDDFQFFSGDVIVSEGTQLLFGTRSCQEVPRGSALTLMSGSEVGKSHVALGYAYDLTVKGTLRVGTKGHPITESVHIGISQKDLAAQYNWGEAGKGLTQQAGLIFARGARVEVHTADPKKARLVIGWHERHNLWFKSRRPNLYNNIPTLIEVVFTDQVLEHVTLDWLHKGGLIVLDRRAHARWKDVAYGPNNAGSAREIVSGALPERMTIVAKVMR